MLTVKCVAEILSVSQGLVYALCAQGKLEHERYGIGRGTIRIREESLAKFQEKVKAGSRRSWPSPPDSSVFKQLNASRLAEAWKERGVPLPSQSRPEGACAGRLGEGKRSTPSQDSCAP